MAAKRHRMTVIQVQTEWFGVELVDKALTRLHRLESIHAWAMDAVEMDRVRVAAAIDEGDAQPIALRAAQGRSRHAPVVGPSGERDAGGDLDQLFGRDKLVLAQRLTTRQRTDRAIIKVGQHNAWVEAISRWIDITLDHVV